MASGLPQGDVVSCHLFPLTVSRRNITRQEMWPQYRAVINNPCLKYLEGYIIYWSGVKETKWTWKISAMDVCLSFPLALSFTREEHMQIYFYFTFMQFHFFSFSHFSLWFMHHRPEQNPCFLKTWKWKKKKGWWFWTKQNLKELMFICTGTSM